MGPRYPYLHPAIVGKVLRIRLIESVMSDCLFHKVKPLEPVMHDSDPFVIPIPIPG